MKYINAKRLKRLLISGSRWLAKHSDILDELNVYPVPDGDTGTNMSMTVKSLEKSLKKIKEDSSIDEIVEIVSEAVLLGARGNSGTILSQIIQGFLKSMLGKDRIYAKDVAEAIIEAKDTAYAAVSNPVEGTILTVVRRAAEEAERFSKENDNLIEMLASIKKAVYSEVENTQNLLPKLKEAGVVDAGAKGFYYFIEGFEKILKDGSIADEIEEMVVENETKEFFQKISSGEIIYKYCTEFIIDGNDFELESYKEKIGSFGDSMVVARGGSKTKTHIHTNNPGLVLEFAMKFGELSNIKIENMAIQHSNILNEIGNKEELTENVVVVSEMQDGLKGIVTVADTKEMADVFIAKGAAAVIIGGQSKNPSVADIEEAMKKVKSKNKIIVPNNKNIIPAAKMAAARNGSDTSVIETKTMCEGYYVVENRYDRAEMLEEELERNITVEVTRAVKDSKSEELIIKKDDFIFLINGKIKISESSLDEGFNKLKNLLKEFNISNTVIFKGKDIFKETDNFIIEYSKSNKIDLYETNQDNYFCYLYFQVVPEGMPKTAVVTDSTADIANSFLDKLPIVEVPLKVKFEGDYFRENIDITKDEFWEKTMNFQGQPKTSQPAPLEFKLCYERMLKKGYKKIISIHISGKLSGTVQSANIGRNMLDKKDDIVIVDTKTASMGQGYLVLECAKYSKEGVEFEKIEKWLYEAVEKSGIYFIVADLKYLEKGGRIGKAQCMIGGILRIKPVLSLDKGEVFTAKKAFGKNSAIKHIANGINEMAEKYPVEFMIGYGGSNKERVFSELAEKEINKITKLKSSGDFQIGSVIGSHTGPVIGVVILPKIKI